MPGVSGPESPVPTKRNPKYIPETDFNPLEDSSHEIICSFLTLLAYLFVPCGRDDPDLQIL